MNERSKTIAPGASSGYFGNGLPYNRFGRGSRIVVIFQGLLLENKPLSGLSSKVFTRIYRFLGAEYTVYIVTRKTNLPDGYTLQDMSDDYAEMIEKEFGAAVDVVGTSTGGSIAQHFAADHPDLLRRLVLHSSAYILNERARASQMRMGLLARQRDWVAVASESLQFVVPRDRWFTGMGVRLGSLALSLTAPKDPSDLIVTVEAEDKHDFIDRLAEIQAPTLVAAGKADPFYSEELFRKTAEGIPDARLILYPDMGHPASGKQFARDVLAFLMEGDPERAESHGTAATTSN